MIIAHGDLLVLLQCAPLNASDGYPAHKLVVVNGGHQHLERLVHIGLGGGNILQNGVEQGLEIRAHHIGRVGGYALPRGTEQHGGIQLFLRGVQIQQQLQHLVHHLMDALVGPIDLVHHHDDPVPHLQSTTQHKAGLWHRALGGVHQQNHAVDHLQNTLHLAAEVSVARGVHNIDLCVAVANGGIFGQNGNAALTLQVIGVHDTIHGLLILPVHTTLLEHFVHQSGLAVVDMGDDGNISQFIVLQW